MSKYYKIINNNNALLISKSNGNSLFLPVGFLNDSYRLNKLLMENRFDEEIYNVKSEFKIDLIETVFISLHVSNNCNLSCKYCFRDSKLTSSLNLSDCKKFIDSIIDRYKKAKKYFVDLTGSGEPLMNLDLILQINDYCKKKSNIIFKEITVMIATNGTMLNQDIVNTLQKSGIIFGISIDGRNKRKQNLRVTKNGEAVHKQVINNVKKIKERGFLGAAYTLTGQTKNLLEDIKYLHRYFPTISVKPVRSTDDDVAINVKNINNIKKMYNGFYNFLLKEAYNCNINYFITILDGEDYFGKFIYRVIMNIRVNARCDAGVGRFSLAGDGLIYSCPAAINIPELVVGNLSNGVNSKKTSNLWKLLNEKKYCEDCFAKYYCGGECLVNSAIHFNELGIKDANMCEYNKHLIKLALLLIHNIKKSKPDFFVELHEFCKTRNERGYTNENIIKVAKAYEDRYSFTDIMRIEFEEKELYLNLLEKS